MKKSLNYKIVASLFFYIVVSVSSAGAQSFDYEVRPRLNFQFTEATIDLEIDPSQNSINGSVSYRLKANIDGADTLSLQAVQLQIDSVMTDGKKIGFATGTGQVEIALTDSSVVGQPYEVKIFYHGRPRFGLLNSSEGTIWTSMLPLSNRHWVPMVDHPGVSFTSTLSLTVPSPFIAVATGVKTDEDILADGRRRITFRSGRPVAVTAIAFALGQFHEEGISYGIKRINSYAEAYSVDAFRQRELVRKAEQVIREVEGKTGMEYPFQRLHVVILNDHQWETKPYGASAIFLYKNRGDLTNQLRRGIYAQWLGVYQREAQWNDAWPINFLQAALHYSLTNAPATLKSADEPAASFFTVYNNFSIENWNFWQHKANWQRPNLQQTVERIIPVILQKGSGIVTPANFEESWYQYSGQPSIDVPAFKSSLTAENAADSDSVRYRVDYELMPAQQSLQLTFEAQKGRIESPLSLPVEMVSGGGINTSSVAFSGAADTVAILLPAGTQNVHLVVPEGQKLILDERKPVAFLIYQLRNAQTMEARVKAAEQIGYHSDNPDLQLALNDFMDQPMAPEVRAALLRSFGDITKGATGTQKRFITALDDENPLVREAALEVLNNYRDEAITSRLKTFSKNEGDERLARKALKKYMERIDSTQARQFVNTLVQQDTAGTKAIAAIATLAEIGSTKAAVERAKYYIEPVYSFAVREQAFSILLNYDTSEEAWNERLQMLLNDSDPRIRFITVKNLAAIPGADSAAVLNEYRSKEYDARVVGVMSRN